MGFLVMDALTLLLNSNSQNAGELLRQGAFQTCANYLTDQHRFCSSCSVCCNAISV